jgi:hypothetical protein
MTMKANIYCGPCKEAGRQTILEVELRGPLSLYDAWCPECRKPISGRAFPAVPVDEPTATEK